MGVKTWRNGARSEGFRSHNPQILYNSFHSPPLPVVAPRHPRPFTPSSQNPKPRHPRCQTPKPGTVSTTPTALKSETSCQCGRPGTFGVLAKYAAQALEEPSHAKGSHGRVPNLLSQRVLSTYIVECRVSILRITVMI